MMYLGNTNLTHDINSCVKLINNYVLHENHITVYNSDSMKRLKFTQVE